MYYIFSIFFTGSNMSFLRLLVSLNFFLPMMQNYNLETNRVIIYEIPSDSEKGSYFGMSVAIRPKAASLKDGWSIQIGAPRSNVDVTGVGGPGAVYRCHTYGPCQVFEMDRGLAPFGGLGNYEFTEKKDAAWIGVAMDIKDLGSHEKNVVCGHRWINQNLKNSENIDVTYLMTGICYLQGLLNQTFESPVKRLLPLLNKDKIYFPKPYVVDLSTYHWGLGQAGISVKFAEEASNLLIGAPGVTHWIGSVIRYEDDSNVAIGNFARTELARKSRYSYLGYSLAFGRFYKDKEFWCVTGAPRSGSYRGEVFLFQFKGSSSDDVRIGTNLMGTTFGEYFGSSLAAADINSDGFDDLIVGAPLFSHKNPDEGRIYVYLGTGRGYFLVHAQIVNGRVGRGRFGSCISSIQDLDQDGYEDVAVSAPYEDDKKGAVYIYRGFSRGLHADYSQRIRAQDINPYLRGFGISISPPVDADGNKYLDIAIGSHLSDHVVLIRSRPIISLRPEIKTDNISLIDRKDSYVNVTICSGYTGSNAPHQVDIINTVEVDFMYGRGTLDSKNSFAKKTIRLRSNQIICEINAITLNLSGKNFSPLQITVRSEMNSCSHDKGNSLLIKEKKSEVPAGFLRMCPIGKEVITSKEIPFAGICGRDLICKSDLELSCDVPDFKNGSYTLVSSDVLMLSMRIRNYGEPAHHAKIKIWSNLKLKHRNKEHEISSAPSKNTYWLPVEGVLAENLNAYFFFQIDLEALKNNNGETHINLIAEIFTSSLESNTENNYCRVSAKLTSDVFLYFSASSSTATIFITKQMSQDQALNAIHYYEVQKMGVSPVKDAELTIYIPSWFEKKLLSFKIETSEWMQLSDYSRNNQISYRNDSSEKPVFEGSDIRDLDRATEKDCPPSNRTLFLNCSSAESECNVLKVFFTREIPSKFSSYVKILLLLNITAIDLVKNGKDIVHFSTSSTLKISEFFENKPKELERSASIILYNEERKSFVDIRIIVLSILAGGSLFCIILMALVKNNFFERTKKKKLKALKDGGSSFVYFATGANSQATLTAP